MHISIRVKLLPSFLECWVAYWAAVRWLIKEHALNPVGPRYEKPGIFLGMFLLNRGSVGKTSLRQRSFARCCRAGRMPGGGLEQAANLEPKSRFKI